MSNTKAKRKPATVATAKAKCHSDQRLVGRMSANDFKTYRASIIEEMAQRWLKNPSLLGAARVRKDGSPISWKWGKLRIRCTAVLNRVKQLDTPNSDSATKVTHGVRFPASRSPLPASSSAS
jgi:hypothetical protein